MKFDPRLENALGTVNEELLDRGIRHAIHLRRYSTTVRNRIVGHLNDKVVPEALSKVFAAIDRVSPNGRGKWTLQYLQEKLQGTYSVLQAGILEAGSQLREELSAFAVAEAEWAAAVVKSVMPIEVSFTIPSVRTLKAAAESRPFQGRHLREWAQKLSFDTRSELRAAIRTGISIGETTPEIMRRIKSPLGRGGVLDTSARHLETITRTATTHVSNYARGETYRENAEIIKGVRYVATLDSRTTDICASLGGQVFDVDRGPRPPMHQRCRSTTVPVIKSWREMGINLREAPPGTRAALGGPVSAKTTFEDWWKRQSREEQIEILGKGRTQLLLRGNLTMKQILDSNYRPLSLKQLVAKENALLRRRARSAA